jgi:hypothetical protein
LCFHPASALGEADVAAVERVVATRVLRLFERRGVLSPEAAREMASWGHNSGFSLDASVQIDAKDRAGLERLLRYCARPVFANERLAWAREGERLRVVDQTRLARQCQTSSSPNDLTRPL